MKTRATLFTILLALGLYEISAQDYSFNIRKVGVGDPILLIPGLASSGHVWDQTIDALKEKYTCHVVTLPGFAGQPSIQSDNYLKTVGDELVTYVESSEMDQPVIIGHSLGGFLTLYLGLHLPSASKLIVVDGLAYMGAAQNPSATPASMKEIAASMRENIRTQTPEQFEISQPKMLASMITDSADIALAMEWGRKSDSETIAQVMYELFQWDLREALSEISTPTLILGSWAGYKEYGVTKEMVRSNFERQFSKLKDKRIRLSEEGKHFIMWDDPEFYLEEVNSFLSDPND